MRVGDWPGLVTDTFTRGAVLLALCPCLSVLAGVERFKEKHLRGLRSYETVHRMQYAMCVSLTMSGETCLLYGTALPPLSAYLLLCLICEPHQDHQGTNLDAIALRSLIKL